LKVAAVQFSPTYGDLRGNLRRLAAMTVQAAKAGARLIVLPELALSGYSMMNRAAAEPLSEVIAGFKPSPTPSLDSSMQAFYSIARTYNAHIVWGVLEKDAGTGNLFNAQVLMCPDGSFESYRKINFFGNDYLWASEGRANPPIRRIEIDDGEHRTLKVGLLICRDVRDKKDDNWKSFYEPGDADVVCLSANWGDGGFPATAWMDFVKDNKTTLIVANRYGKEIPNNFGEGGICIIKPDGTVHCEGLIWEQDCIVHGEV
jgi:predicted amidohydrolase